MVFHLFDIITILIFFIFIFGLFKNEPSYFIQINFFIKAFIAIYLIYRFNDFRKVTSITLFDQKICSSAGIYLLIVSFADVINAYFNYIRNIVVSFLKINLKLNYLESEI